MQALCSDKPWDRAYHKEGAGPKKGGNVGRCGWADVGPPHKVGMDRPTSSRLRSGGREQAKGQLRGDAKGKALRILVRHECRKKKGSMVKGRTTIGKKG